MRAFCACVCRQMFLPRWGMPPTHLMCLSPPSPRSMTSSWDQSTAFFVSSHSRQIVAAYVLLLCERMNPRRCNMSGSAHSSFLSLQASCPSWATAFCYLLHITSARPWSQRSFSSLICPLVTLGWHSLYSLWQFHQLSHTGISPFPLYFMSFRHLNFSATK